MVKMGDYTVHHKTSEQAIVVGESTGVKGRLSAVVKMVEWIEEIREAFNEDYSTFVIYKGSIHEGVESLRSIDLQMYLDIVLIIQTAQKGANTGE